jgi:hypothetical protein
MSRRRQSTNPRNVFILLGIVLQGLAVAAAVAALAAYRRDRHIAETFVAVPAVVAGGQVREQRAGRGSRRYYQVRAIYRYTVDGKGYESSSSSGGWVGAAETEKEAEQDLAVRYPVGREVIAYIDPADPADVVLERPRPGLEGLLIPAGIALLGLPGCVYGVICWRRWRRTAARGRPG